jgi:hypothetical protein
MTEITTAATRSLAPDELFSEMTTDTILIELVNAIGKLQESHDEIKATVAEINEKVQPMLEGLESSMIGKLLGMGGK